jgi:hypothetical protein
MAVGGRQQARVPTGTARFLASWSVMTAVPRLPHEGVGRRGDPANQLGTP